MHCTDALLALLLALKNTSQNQGNKHYYARSTSLEKLSQTLPWRRSTSYKLQISGQTATQSSYSQTVLGVEMAVFGIYFGGKWASGRWAQFWFSLGIAMDMTFLELFPVIVALTLYNKCLQNSKMFFILTVC